MSYLKARLAVMLGGRISEDELNRSLGQRGESNSEAIGELVSALGNSARNPCLQRRVSSSGANAGTVRSEMSRFFTPPAEVLERCKEPQGRSTGSDFAY